MPTTTPRVAVVLYFLCVFFLCVSAPWRDQLIFDANAHSVNMKRSANCGLLYSCELCASAWCNNHFCNRRNHTQRTEPAQTAAFKIPSRALCVCASARCNWFSRFNRRPFGIWNASQVAAFGTSPCELCAFTWCSCIFFLASSL